MPTPSRLATPAALFAGFLATRACLEAETFNRTGASRGTWSATGNWIEGAPNGGTSTSTALIFGASGAFAATTLPALADGLAWNTDQLAAAGVWSISGAAIPEPATGALLGGLASLAWAATRRAARSPLRRRRR